MKSLKVIFGLFSLGVTVVFLYFKNCLTFHYLAIALVLYFVSSAVHILTHESGHFFGGAVSGYRLLYFQIGPLYIVMKDGKRSFMWARSVGGQCVMIPKRTDKIHFAAYNIGGVAANVLVFFLSLSLLIPESLLCTILFVEVACVGVQKIFINAIPNKSDSAPNDGYITKLLKKDEAVRKDYAMYLSLYGKLFLEEEIVLQDYIYERKETDNAAEMIYYNEIQNILKSLKTNKS